MPTTIINSVTDLTNWVAGIPADMGGATYRGEMNNTGEYVLSSQLTFSGHSNGSIVLTTAAGQSFRDNPTVQSNALRYNAANGVAITSIVEAGATIFCDDDFTVFDGLQIQNTATFGAKALHLGAVPESITLSDLILDARLTTGIVHDLSAGGDRTNVLIIDRSRELRLLGVRPCRAKFSDTRSLHHMYDRCR